MGEYVYKVTPANVREVIVKLDSGELVEARVGLYKYAYKPYHGIGDGVRNAQLAQRHLAPAERAFRAKGIEPPAYGTTANTLEVGDPVYRTTGHVGVLDDSTFANRVGVVHSKAQKLIDPTQTPEVVDPGDAEFADRINPCNFNFSPKLAAIVGAIIGHDYGVRDGNRGGQLTSITITSDGFVTAGSTASDGGGAFIGEVADLERNLNEYRKELAPADLAEFNHLYEVRVKDWRTR